MPALFAITDETRGGDVATMLQALPRSTAVIFRHYGAAKREELGRRLRAIAKARGLVFLVAGDPKLAGPRLRMAEGYPCLLSF